MNKDLGTYELIQQYLKGKLSGDKLYDFEKRLSSEKDFRNYVENHQLGDQMIKNNELNVIKKELQKIHQENINSGGSWKMISMILFGFLLSFFAWKYFNTESNEQSVNSESKIEQIADGNNDNLKELENSLITDIDHSNNNDGIQIKDNKNKHKIEINNQENNYQTDKPKIVINATSMNLKKISTETLIGSEKPQELTPLDKNNLTHSEADAMQHSAGCDPYEIRLDVEFHPTCIGKSEGYVKIVNDDFSMNYQYAIDKGSPQANKKFSGLSAGKHNLFVVDEDGCKSNAVSVTVEEVNCEIIIQPAQNIYWDIPKSITQVKGVKLEILNVKSGQLVYEKYLDQFEQNIWKGRSSSGQNLPMGAYIYSFVLEGKTYTGNITILQ